MTNGRKQNDEWKYDQIFTEDDLRDVMYKAVQKMAEKCQILHHASIYEFDRMVFLVGDREGFVLNGNIISLVPCSIRSYISVLGEMYDGTLTWAYKK